MEYRQRETEGAPYVLGMAAGVLLIFASVFCGGFAAKLFGAVAAEEQRLVLLGVFWLLAVETALNPGVFMLLLLSGKHREERGKAFAVLWAAVGAYTVLSVFFPISVSGVFRMEGGIPSPFFAETAMSAAFRFAGGALMIASCVQFYKRLKGRA
ncbi:hypothetical protein [Caproicibacter sp.]|uniref:hypothetical protein n=1 Tax=Caproicibacter sp. TaxID=2814884 RepID=UPI0039895700